MLKIGELSERTGVASSALRYYEELGLLAPTDRVSGHRRYGRDAVVVVGVILLLRDVGFTLSEIGELMRGHADGTWRDVAQRKVAELDDRIAKATVARTALDHALHCPHDDILECPVFWSFVEGRVEGKALAEAHCH